MTHDGLIEYAMGLGFQAASIINTREIVFDPSFRPYCEENLCGQYGANYSCPPDCGSPEAMKHRILAHRKALVLESMWQIEDFSQKAVIRKAKFQHNKAEIKLMQRARSEGISGFMVGASGCSLCSPCAITQGKPCNFPDQQYSCMSAYCIFVRKLAELCGMEYDCRPGFISFFGMYVFD